MDDQTTNDRAIMPVMTMQAVIERRNAIVEFTRKAMKVNVDFGIIPGTGTKPTLLKPGAEKLCTLFGLSARFSITDKIEDWTGSQHDGEPMFYYSYKCALWYGNRPVAEGEGSCNSHEKKYRYRNGERICPKCGKANIRKSKQGGGWYCWAKLGGCGATFEDGDATIESQSVGQVLNLDIADQVNTIQKMAQKRALIAATLLAVNASEFFTQDMDDMIIEGEYHKDPGPELKDDYSTSKNGGNGKAEYTAWPAQVITWAVQKWNLKPQQVVGALNKSTAVKPTDSDTVLQEWLSAYRAARETQDSDQSARFADNERGKAIIASKSQG